MNCKKYILGLIVLLMTVIASAQKSDYNWVSGYDSYMLPDTGGGAYFGNTMMDFSHFPVKITYDSLFMNFDETNTSYSDSDGNLLFYTNGVRIGNPYNEMIANSDSLNAGWLQYVWDPSIQLNGYRSSQSILAIQSLANSSQYYLIHSFIDSVPGSGGNNIFCSKIYVTLLDMSLNNGHGGVLFKNRMVLQGNLGTEITATRHGNGRYWWFLVQERNTNCYYKLLLDTGGINLLPEQYCWGSIEDSDDIGATCFSPDGSKYIYFDYFNGINIFNFDRCTGEFSDPAFIPIRILRDSIWIGMGAAVSPNNRFLYVTATKQIYQFDLSASDIAASIDTIAFYDNYLAPFGSYFNTAQLGPDGRIYISCGNGDTVYHVINNPNEKGVNCNFVEHGVYLPSLSLGVPNFPNYRLGALTQSQCDSLSTFTQDVRDAKEKILRVFPNPANDRVTVDYGFTDWNKGAVDLEITNALGQIICTQSLPTYSGYQHIDITAFATGLYTVYIKRGAGVVATQKLVVAH